VEQGLSTSSPDMHIDILESITLVPKENASLVPSGSTVTLPGEAFSEDVENINV